MGFGVLGDLYFCDQYNGRVRKVDANGLITTVAGPGSIGGYSGDGGPATDASFGAAETPACDLQGNLFIADRRRWPCSKVDRLGDHQR